MATASGDPLRHLASYIIRPALVEARLVTNKHAGDAVYMATLAEELLSIEGRIAAMEQSAPVGSVAPSSRIGDSHGSKDWFNADWIRTKSSELELRLRRIEQRPTNDKAP